ncbi:hypothetical protein [Methanoculleus bourgensis]|jgi:hypothetical protein|uniref:Uncharacterized protein n=1 Tax=Methanoculleus bourgensis TaxID=83986 RepID=A0A0X3BKQ3_9EURY|nr:hypothetical protein [Methanoculleus bourgensis]CVK32470.1 exported protein of unknown function [Methanoculleus bourgensis]
MAIRAAAGYLTLLLFTGFLLAAGCISVPLSSNNQIPVDAYPRSPLKIVAPIHYLGTTVSESETAMTTLILNLTIAPEVVASGTPAQDREVNITAMYITYSDTRDLYFLDPGEYSLSRREGDDVLEPGEVVELTLPLQQPIPANTDVYADLWIPHHGTLTLSFRTPEVVESSGRLPWLTAAPFVPY